jgi:UDP-GlcNAc:undecaprenyl-phosphate GlcNAc-1-phosphate transferase
MIPLLLPFILTCILCVLLIPPLRKLAIRCGQVDNPDGARKLHPKPVALAGGLAILLSSIASLAALKAAGWPTVQAIDDDLNFLIGLVVASIFICVLGIIDDRILLRGKYKLAGQLVAVAIVVNSGIVVREINLFGSHLELGNLAVPFTVAWLIGAINSLNLIDGMDGLLGSLGLIICLSLAIMGSLSGQLTIALLAITLAGALAGFLCYNFPPASVFLGDAGSMLIGLVIGVLAVRSSFKGTATVALSVPIALLAIPFFDTFAAITRRKLTGKSLYIPDREHLHHCLQRRGFSNRRALLYVSCFGALTATGAMITVILQNETYAILTTALAITLLITTRLFGYSEFLLIKKRLSDALPDWLAPRRNPDCRAVEIRFHGTADWQTLWSKVVEAATEFDFASIVLDMNALCGRERYHARWTTAQVDAGSIEQWQASLPLSLNGAIAGHLQIVGRRDCNSMARQIGCVADLVDELEMALSTLLEPSEQHSEIHTGTPVLKKELAFHRGVPSDSVSRPRRGDFAIQPIVSSLDGA